MKDRDMLRIAILGLLVLMLWGAYFAVCGVPEGATFIYADF